MLNDLKQGKITFADILKLAGDPDSKSDKVLVAGRIRLRYLLNHMPYIGKKTVAQIISLSDVPDDSTMRSLCTPQRRNQLMRVLRVMVGIVPELRQPGVLGMRLEPAK
jgi:hypothetical protein